ncbi:MAG: beta-lactamase family protein [Bacteroidia bacterium]|nr:beta-lactamase family protein [Bacteroidia bacterium]
MRYLLILIIPCLALFSCEDLSADINPATYSCEMTFADNSESNPNKDEYQKSLETFTQSNPTVQVSVKNATSDWNGATGMADIAKDIPFTPCSPSMVGSISKLFTGVLMMQLHEEGILSVDDPLSKWLDTELIENIPNAKLVSLRQCLNHTTGIPDYLGIKHYIDAVNKPNFKLTQAEKLTYTYGSDPVHEPGKVFDYSNSNYVILGLVIEKARNMTLWDAVETYIAQPLGLQHTQMGTHDDPIPDGTALPYRRAGNNYQEVKFLAVSDAATGDGGMASNGQELIEFMKGIFDGRLMKQETLSMMLQDSVPVMDQSSYDEWPDEHYGLGIEVYQTPYGVAYGHQGSTTSYEAYLLYYPEKETGMATLYSYDGGGYTARRTLHESLLATLFK